MNALQKLAQALSRRSAIPIGVWALGGVSLLMDVSSEMIHALLPIYLVTIMGASMEAVAADSAVAIEHCCRGVQMASGSGEFVWSESRLDPILDLLVDGGAERGQVAQRHAPAAVDRADPLRIVRQPAILAAGQAHRQSLDQQFAVAEQEAQA